MKDTASQRYQTPQRRTGTTTRERPYNSKKNMKDVENLLTGIEELVHKGNLARNYRQEGGQ